MGLKPNILKRWVNYHTLSILFNLINLTVYGAACSAAVFTIVKQVDNVIAINGILCGISLLLMLNEFHASPLSLEYFRFLTTFRGRSILYIILAVSVYQPILEVNTTITYYLSAIGLCYIILSFVPQLMHLTDLRTSYRLLIQYNEELNGSFCGNRGEQKRAGGYYQPDTIRNNNNNISNTVPFEYSPDSKPDRFKMEISMRNSIYRRDEVELAMEINSALSGIQYSDFTSIPEIPASTMCSRASKGLSAVPSTISHNPLSSHFHSPDELTPNLTRHCSLRHP